MKEPGALQAFQSRGAAEWEDTVRDVVAGAFRQVGNEAHRLRPEDKAAGITSIDWTGFDTRVGTCLGRRHALELLDWREGEGFGGGRSLQEEYLEWRVVRSSRGIERVELTTELSAYWTLLAAHDPDQLLELVAAFAHEASVPASCVYGSCSPGGRGVTADDRARAFRRTMLPPHGTSPYNNGERAICCMTQQSNTLAALAWLAAAATTHFSIRDALGAQLRCLTSSEAIPLLAGAAVAGRASDPVLVERLGRLAYEGRRLGFAEPVGVYIEGFEATRLRTPGGDTVPLEWCSFSRGAAAGESCDDRSRYQRLVVEVPGELGYCISDLIDVATEQPIRYGGEIADLTQVVVFLTVSEAGYVPTDIRDPIDIDAASNMPECTDIYTAYSLFRRSGQGL